MTKRRGGGGGVNWGEGENFCPLSRARAGFPTTSKTEFSVTIVISRRSLTIFKKNFILDATGFLVLPLLFPLL